MWKRAAWMKVKVKLKSAIFQIRGEPYVITLKFNEGEYNLQF